MTLRIQGLVAVALAVFVALLGSWFVAPAGATATGAPAPGWAISVIAQPADFSPNTDPICQSNYQSRLCDSYAVLVTNVGGKASEGPVTITDALPAGLVSSGGIRGVDLRTNEGLRCTTAPLQCVNLDETSVEVPVPPGDTLVMTVNVLVAEELAGSVVDTATVSGGGAPPAAASKLTTISSEQAPFGIADFHTGIFSADGSQAGGAAARPNGLLTSLAFPTREDVHAGNGGGSYYPVEDVRDVVVDLPPGLVGNPQTLPRCPLVEFDEAPKSTGRTSCPPASRIGSVVLQAFGGNVVSSENPHDGTTALYNLEPEAGFPAEFGFTLSGKNSILYGSLAHTDAGYVERVSTPGIVAIGVDIVSLEFFGDPAQRDGGATESLPFFTNPSDCAAGPLTSRVRADSWQHPGRWVTAESTSYPNVTECNLLQFAPTLRVQPDNTQAGQPAGYEVDVRSPQNESALTPGTPPLKTATVTLPPGTALSTSAADGLVGCAAEGPEGFNEGTSWNAEGVSPSDPEATETGPDGLPQIAPGHCPPASQVGTVEITTPLLSKPLSGHLFVSQPKCGGAGQAACTSADAADGNLFGVYLEAAESGVVLKLTGKLSASPVTGQLTATFAENPQQPFSEAKIRLKSGPRAVLTNPPACGTATATSDISAWSSPVTPDATPSSGFLIDEGCAAHGFAPAFTAGTTGNQAGQFSPFSLTFSRTDQDQNLSGIQVQTPPGLLANLASVPLCGERQASQGTCPAASQIGHVTVASGAGSAPLYLPVPGQPPNPVYLTTGYKGAPFGLSVVVPAVAGPYNLGNVVVRSAVSVDPHTSQVTITSDPLPTILDGVPLQVKTVNVTVDRRGFMFNPTSCEALKITGTIASTEGASANVSSPFQAGNCANLPFKPSFTASTRGNGSKANGAGLTVRISTHQGPSGNPAVPSEANIQKVNVQLPVALPSRLKTLQKACTAKQFASNPAGCPPESAVGTAVAHTPVLPVPLEGPAYLVSHGGAAFPDLVIVLQGDGVRIDLTGETQITRGLTYSKFETAPDAPISSFELKLPEGPYSVLGANGNLCGRTTTTTVSKRVTRRVHGHTIHTTIKVKKTIAAPLLMPTTITAQNGAVLKQNTKINATGCPKAANAKTSTSPTHRRH
jgi:hypothetical protein